MDTIKIEGFILKSQYGQYMHSICEMTAYGYMTVCPYTVEVPMPAEFNPVKAEVDMLNAKLDDLQEKHEQATKIIKDRISNLLCLEYTPS